MACGHHMSMVNKTGKTTAKRMPVYKNQKKSNPNCRPGKKPSISHRVFERQEPLFYSRHKPGREEDSIEKKDNA